MRAASGGCGRPCSPASRPTCAEGYGGSTDVGSKLRDRGRPRRDEAPRGGRGAGSVRPPPHPAAVARARPGGAHVGDRGRRRTSCARREEAAAVGFGIPVTLDQRTGTAVYSTHLPLAGVPFASVMSERLGIPVVVDNDGNCAVLAEARFGAGEGSGDVVMLTLGTGIGGGLVLGGRLQRGWIGAGGGARPHGRRHGRARPARAHCPNRGCLEVMASGSALVREASLRVARRPDTALGLALEEGRELTGPFVTEMAHDGDPVALDAIGRSGRALGVGLASLVERPQPGGDRDRRRRDRGRRHAARAGAGGDARRARCRRRATRCASWRPRSARRRG